MRLSEDYKTLLKLSLWPRSSPSCSQTTRCNKVSRPSRQTHNKYTARLTSQAVYSSHHRSPFHSFQFPQSDKSEKEPILIGMHFTALFVALVAVALAAAVPAPQQAKPKPVCISLPYHRPLSILDVVAICRLSRNSIQPPFFSVFPYIRLRQTKSTPYITPIAGLPHGVC